MVMGWDDVLLAAGGSAVAGAVSSAFGGGLDLDENKELMAIANQFNATEAQKAREFSRAMSSTAYQRSRRDMENAGLNPMLMMAQGGASTPGSASASSVASPSTSRHQQAVQTAMSTAKDTAALLTQIDKARAETHKTDKEAVLTGAITNKTVQDTVTSGATAKKLEAEKDLVKANAKLTQENEWRAKSLNDGWKGVLNFFDRVTGGGGASAKGEADNPYRMDRYLPRKEAVIEPKSGGRER